MRCLSLFFVPTTRSPSPGLDNYMHKCNVIIFNVISIQNSQNYGEKQLDCVLVANSWLIFPREFRTISSWFLLQFNFLSKSMRRRHNWTLKTTSNNTRRNFPALKERNASSSAYEAKHGSQPNTTYNKDENKVTNVSQTGIRPSFVLPIRYIFTWLSTKLGTFWQILRTTISYTFHWPATLTIRHNKKASTSLTATFLRLHVLNWVSTERGMVNPSRDLT